MDRKTFEFKVDFNFSDKLTTYLYLHQKEIKAQVGVLIHLLI